MRFFDVFSRKSCGFAVLCGFLIHSSLEEPKITFLVLLKLIMTSHHWGENEIHETKTDSLKFLAVPLETQRLIVKCSSRKTAKNNGSITESELTKKNSKNIVRKYAEP